MRIMVIDTVLSKYVHNSVGKCFEPAWLQTVSVSICLCMSRDQHHIRSKTYTHTRWRFNSGRKTCEGSSLSKIPTRKRARGRHLHSYQGVGSICGVILKHVFVQLQFPCNSLQPYHSKHPPTDAHDWAIYAHPSAHPKDPEKKPPTPQEHPRALRILDPEMPVEAIRRATDPQKKHNFSRRDTPRRMHMIGQFMCIRRRVQKSPTST